MPVIICLMLESPMPISIIRQSINITYFPLLTVVNCGALTNPANGQVSYIAGTTFGQRATYSCNTGYKLVGSGTRTCQGAGSWSGSAPTCQGKLLLHPTCMCTWCRQVFCPVHMLYIGDSIYCTLCICEKHIT